MTDIPPYPGVPRWVKVSGILTGLLILLLVVVGLGGFGGHGPGRHASLEAGGHGRGVGLPALLSTLVLAVMALNWRWFVERAVRVTRGPTAMTPRLRKFVLVAHVTSSVGSLGAVAVFLALAVAGLASQDAQMVRAAYIANELIAWHVVLPLIIAALLIGVIQSLGTPWGLLRHYWVLAKLLLTVMTIYILLQQLDGISYAANVAANTTLSSADLLGLRRSLRIHAAGGLMVLLILTTLSIYKPRGMTRYGWQKQHTRHREDGDVGSA